MATATVTKIDKRPARKRYSHRNPRVRRVHTNQWLTGRIQKFTEACKWAAAAKATRTALGVTQGEVANHYGVGSHTVCNWESGHYFGWNKEELAEYTKVCHELGEAAK